MAPCPRSDQLVAEIRIEFPQFCVRSKAGSAIQKIIHGALCAITLGAQRHYLDRYHTVLGSTLWVPPTWEAATDEDRYILLRHERIHLRQRRRLGTIGLAAAYLLPLLPLGLAYGRACLEWAAYRETLRATAEVHGLDAARSPTLRAHIIKQFVSGAYGWMWPFPKVIGRWIDSAVDEIQREREMLAKKF